MKIIDLKEYKPGYVKVELEHRRFYLWKEYLTCIISVPVKGRPPTVEYVGKPTYYNVIVTLRNGRIVSGRRKARKLAEDSVRIQEIIDD